MNEDRNAVGRERLGAFLETPEGPVVGGAEAAAIGGYEPTATVNARYHGIAQNQILHFD